MNITASTTTGETRLLIDGELRHSGSNALFENINPATKEVLGTVADATAEDMDAADTLQGPQINEAHRDKVLGLIQTGIEQGARLVTGGGRPAHLEKGWFVEPTLFADVDNSMTIAQEEIFGPVLSVIPFDDDEDAVRIANDSEYGLSGMVSSGDLARAVRVANRIRSGTMTVNGAQWYGAEAPFGGFKASGVGRQNGDEGAEQHLETRAIGLPLSDAPGGEARDLQVVVQVDDGGTFVDQHVRPHGAEVRPPVVVSCFRVAFRDQLDEALVSSQSGSS